MTACMSTYLAVTGCITKTWRKLQIYYYHPSERAVPRRMPHADDDDDDDDNERPMAPCSSDTPSDTNLIFRSLIGVFNSLGY
jgi:hypothetical protein